MAQAQEVFLFNPTQISGCQLWFDASDLTTLIRSGTTVTRWDDKSGNGRNASNVTGTPVLSNNSLISRQGVFFNGTSYLTGGFTYSLNTLSWFVVGTMDSDGDQYGRLLSFGDPGQYDFDSTLRLNALSREAATNELITYRNGYISRNLFITYSSPFMYSSVLNGSSNSPFLNGTQGTGSATSGNFGFNTFGLSASFGLNVQRNKGFLFEVVVYSAALSTFQRQQIEGYLAWKWGLQGSLPASHPFKGYRPLAQTPFPTTIPVMPTIGAGTPGFSPSQVPNCSAWYDGADPLGTGTKPTLNTTLTTWFDKSGNMRNASGGVPPTFVSGGVSFNGTSQYYSINIPYPSNYSIFLVATNTTAVQCYFFARNSIAGGREPTFIQGYIGAGIGLEWYEGSDRGTIATTPASPFIASVDHIQGTNIVGFYYGNQSFNISQTRPYNSAAWDTLGQAGATINVGYYGGTMKELIFYSNVVTTTQRQQIEGYLAWKWGLQGNLPDTQPYKRNPVDPFPTRTTPFVGSLNVWLPTRISGSTLWLDGADPNGNGVIPGNGATVSTWIDKSGSGNTVSAGSGQPTYSTNVSNRLGGLTFNGSQGLAKGSVSAGSLAGNNTTTFSMFVVCSFTNNSQNSMPISWDDSTYAYRILLQYYAQTPEIDFAFGATAGGAGVVLPAFSPTNNQFYIYSGVRNGPIGYMAVNGGTLSKTTSGLSVTNFSATSYTLNVGTYINDPLNYNMKGTTCEIIFYNSALTDTQRQQVEGYLAWKWGLVGSLPANHPYKLFPPSP